MKCPNCNAEIRAGSKFCEYCGSQITPEMRTAQEQVNKDGCPKCGSSNITFSREKLSETHGKKKTTVERSTVGVCKDCGYTWQVEGSATKKRHTLLWILGWLFCFPIPITILIWRKQNKWDKKIKIAVTAVLWLLVIVLGTKNDGNSSSTASSSPAKEPVTTVDVEEKKDNASVTEDQKEEPTTEEAIEEASETEEATEEPKEEITTEKITEEEPTKPEIEYEEVTVKEMFDLLESNALKAKDKYEGKYLEITGRLNTIDSSGKYIALYPDEYSFSGVSCYLKNDIQKSQVANMTEGDTVTVKGKCTSVGEILGYSFDIDSINGYEEGVELDFETTDDGYIIVSANKLVEIVKENPLKTRNALKDKNIELTGKLGTIDSDGKYIGIDSDDEWSFTNIQCYIKNDQQKSQIMEMSSGDTITIRGKCKDVGEVLGYSIDIELIK